MLSSTIWAAGKRGFTWCRHLFEAALRSTLAGGFFARTLLGAGRGTEPRRQGPATFLQALLGARPPTIHLWQEFSNLIIHEWVPLLAARVDLICNTPLTFDHAPMLFYR